MKISDIGVIGLAVMGENLILNIESRGYSVSAYNRTSSKTNSFISKRALGKNIKGYIDFNKFIDSLDKPRKILLMIKAGNPVDSMIDKLIPLLSSGDIIIDGGNSNFEDTLRRYNMLIKKEIHFMGVGISGGEEGALKGPSIMPGGSNYAWKHTKNILQDISAKYEGESCCRLLGENATGHFVKMVHNGIEYGDMQIIAESYNLLKFTGFTNERISRTFEEWNTGKLKSFLIEITSEIFKKKENGKYVIDNILDKAGQKGTGRWTAINSLNLGVPLTTITQAVFARNISSLKSERTKAEEILKLENIAIIDTITKDEIRDALYASKIISYAQGFELLRVASKEFNWNINYVDVASIWRAGCIIRSTFLNKIMNAFSKNEQNLLFDDYFNKEINRVQKSWRKVVAFAISNGIAIPAMSSALSYFDALRTKDSPANLIQAQRDFFGAHTYEKKDMPRGKFFHTNWTGKSGSTSSTTYDA